MDSGLKRKSDINVTPLIDIVLVLLIVFIVMLPSLTKSLPVLVPKLVSAPPKADPNDPPVVVSLLREPDGRPRYLLQSEAIQLQDLPARLTPVLLRQVPGMRKVFLKVDGELPYQAAVDVLDRIRQASDDAKAQTKRKSGVDGGDVRVAISVKG